MKVFLIVLFVLTLILIALVIKMNRSAEEGLPLGLIEGKLSPCPDKKNCICSEYEDDASHYGKAIEIPQNSNLDLVLSIKEAARSIGGEIKIEKGDYLAFTYTSNIFRFVDDLEVKIDRANKLIHFRSASRVGYSDLGVNKKRITSLKRLLKPKFSKSH